MNKAYLKSLRFDTQRRVSEMKKQNIIRELKEKEFLQGKIF